MRPLSNAPAIVVCLLSLAACGGSDGSADPDVNAGALSNAAPASPANTPVVVTKTYSGSFLVGDAEHHAKMVMKLTTQKEGTISARRDGNCAATIGEASTADVIFTITGPKGEKLVENALTQKEQPRGLLHFDRDDQRDLPVELKDGLCAGAGRDTPTLHVSVVGGATGVRLTVEGKKVDVAAIEPFNGFTAQQSEPSGIWAGIGIDFQKSEPGKIKDDVFTARGTLTPTWPDAVKFEVGINPSGDPMAGQLVYEKRQAAELKLEPDAS